jgi:hypothetical protein
MPRRAGAAAGFPSSFPSWHALSILKRIKPMARMVHMTTREIIRALILSPLYLSLKLKDRVRLIRSFQPKHTGTRMQ